MVGVTKKRTAAGESSWIDVVRLPMVICSLKGDIILANTAAMSQFAIPPTEETSPHLSMILDTAGLTRLLRRLASNDHEQNPQPEYGARDLYQVRNSSGGDSQFNLEIGSSGAVDDDQYVSLIFSPANCTIGDHTNQLEDLAEHLSTIRHKLSSPLTGVMVMVDVLLRNTEDNLTPRQLTHLADARESLKNLAAMIHDVDLPTNVTAHSSFESDGKAAV